MPTNKIFMTLKRTLKIVFMSSLMFSLSTSAAQEVVLDNNNPVSLFGIGIHQEKRFDIYVGALYAPASTSDVSGLTDPYIAKRMSLKFLSKYSNRKMSRMWKQRIAMNNGKDKWRPLTKEIVQFASIFKRAMQAGDEINIDYIPTIGTKVTLNGTAFITIENPEFFDLLLNIWLGSVPPTERFKIGISGGNPDNLQTELIAKFDSLSPVVGRFDDDLNKPKTQVAVAEKPKTTPRKETPAEVKKAEPKKKPESKPVAKKEQPTSTPKKQESEPIANSSVNENPTSTKPSTTALVDRKELFKTDLGGNKTVSNSPAKQSNTENSSPAKKQNDKPAPVQTQPAEKQPTKVAKVDPPQEEFFDADLLSGSYTQELINTIRKYQSYPKKALAAGEEGNVTALVTIDKDGEIVEYEITERAASRTLNREVLRMIRRAAPFPKIPTELEMEQFEFEVPMNFKLAR